MSFSEFLNTRRDSMKSLVKILKTHYEYVSVLGSDIVSRSVRVNKNSSSITPGGDTECGFVVKMSNGGPFFEYSVDDVAGDPAALANKICRAFDMNEQLQHDTIGNVHMPDEPLKKSFARPSDFEEYTENQVLDFCSGLCKDILGKSQNLLNVMVSVGTLEVSKLFISANRELDQNYTWVNGYLGAVY